MGLPQAPTPWPWQGSVVRREPEGAGVVHERISDHPRGGARAASLAGGLVS